MAEQPSSKPLVDRLRDWDTGDDVTGQRLLMDAADEIERLHDKHIVACDFVIKCVEAVGRNPDVESVNLIELAEQVVGCIEQYKHAAGAADEPHVTQEVQNVLAWLRTVELACDARDDRQSVTYIGQARALLHRLSRASEPPPAARDEHDESGRTGVFRNCGYVGTACGWIVRDGTYWVATFRGDVDASQYVAFRNAPPPAGTRTNADYALEHAGYLAIAAEQFIDSIDEFDNAANALDEGTDDETDDELKQAVDSAFEARCDHRQGLSNAIYEFRKRAERAAATKTEAITRTGPCECELCGAKSRDGWRIYCAKDGCPGYAAEIKERAVTKAERRVGCETSDGTLRVHSENETCDVCGPVEKPLYPSSKTVPCLCTPGKCLGIKPFSNVVCKAGRAALETSERHCHCDCELVCIGPDNTDKRCRAEDSML